MSDQPIVRNTVELNIKPQHWEVFNHNSDKWVAIGSILCFERQNKLLFNSSSADANTA